MQYLLTYRSLTYAQRAGRVLERAGVTGWLMKVPRDASARGCAYCVAVPARYRDRAVAVLAGAHLAPERVLLRREDGSWEAAE